MAIVELKYLKKYWNGLLHWTKSFQLFFICLLFLLIDSWTLSALFILFSRVLRPNNRLKNNCYVIHVSPKREEKTPFIFFPIYATEEKKEKINIIKFYKHIIINCSQTAVSREKMHTVYEERLVILYMHHNTLINKTQMYFFSPSIQNSLVTEKWKHKRLGETTRWVKVLLSTINDQNLRQKKKKEILAWST